MTIAWQKFDRISAECADEARARLSFAHFETINPYGTMVFDIADVRKRSRRPLRRP